MHSQAAPVALWGDDLPIRRCTVRRHRNRLGHAPDHRHDAVTEDDRDMIDADIAAEVERRRKAFLRKGRLKCRAVADSVEEAGARLFDPPVRTRRTGSPPAPPTPSNA
jgi:transposase-like protein